MAASFILSKLSAKICDVKALIPDVSQVLVVQAFPLLLLVVLLITGAINLGNNQANKKTNIITKISFNKKSLSGKPLRSYSSVYIFELPLCSHVAPILAL